ncbi:hypothetical protein ACLMAJ_19155 [Nocardia sp. KC 131]|uniref:hypothetical protein n=1 Tax=Nocardia arseniciresistens TaxID=3392119 RepID=UPI00398EF8F8
MDATDICVATDLTVCHDLAVTVVPASPAKITIPIIRCKSDAFESRWCNTQMVALLIERSDGGAGAARTFRTLATAGGAVGDASRHNKQTAL